MNNTTILTLHLDSYGDYASREAYEAAVSAEVRALMGDGHDASRKMREIFYEHPDATLLALLYGEEKERERAREAIENAFREEAESNILSDWQEVPLTEGDLVSIFRELGAATVNALVAKAFG